MNPIIQFAIDNSDYPEHVRALYSSFEGYRGLRAFESKLPLPMVCVEPLNCKKWFGLTKSLFAGPAQTMILVDSSIIDFCTLPDKYAIAKLVLLHELAHLYMLEIRQQTTKNIKEYHGFGFASLCNSIGRELGFRPVRSALRGKKTTKPTCASWPFSVLPALQTEIGKINNAKISAGGRKIHSELNPRSPLRELTTEEIGKFAYGFSAVETVTPAENVEALAFVNILLKKLGYNESPLHSLLHKIESRLQTKELNP